MAVDVLSENRVDIISPRISFSHDLEEEQEEDAHTNNNPMFCRLDHTLLDPTPFDFAFNVDSTTFFHSSTAEELFSNGRIIPTGVKKQEEKNIKRILEKYPEILTSCSDPHTPEPKKKSLKEFLEDSIDEDEEEEESNTLAKSFWKFRRSNSLNFDKKRLIGSLKILSRSGSTGKFLEKIIEEDEAEKPINVKPFWKFNRSSSINSAIINTNVNKHSNCNKFRRSSSLNCTISGTNQGLSGSDKHLPRSKSAGSAPNQKNSKSSSKKGQIRNMKIYGYGNGNNTRLSPVLNLPSPYISRVSVDLFGFGSLFCKGSTRDRKKKKC